MMLNMVTMVTLMIRVIQMISDLLAPPSSGETTMHCSRKIIRANAITKFNVLIFSSQLENDVMILDLIGMWFWGETSSQLGMWFLIQVQNSGSTFKRQQMSVNWQESTGTLRQSTGWSKKPSSCGEWGSSIIRWSAPALRSTPSSLKILQSIGPLSLFYFSLFSESYPFKLPLIKYWWWRAHLLSIFAISLLEIGERREDFWSPLEYGK